MLNNKTKIRNFSWDDLQEWTAFYNKSNGFNTIDTAFQIDSMAEFLTQYTVDPQKNCSIVEAQDEIIGYSMISPEILIKRVIAQYGVKNSSTDRDTERRIIESIIQRTGELGATKIHIQAHADNISMVDFLEKNGFTSIKIYFLMEWISQEINPPIFPTNFHVRSFVKSQDENDLTQIQNDSFKESWGFCPNTVQEIKAKLDMKISDPRGIIFATDNNKLVAYNWTFRTPNPSSKTGCIGMMGVHPNYRGLGLGKNILLAGLQYLSTTGIDSVRLEVDSLNISAIKIYSDAGFQITSESKWYEKILNK